MDKCHLKKFKSLPSAEMLVSFSNKRNQKSMGKCMILELGQDIYKMSLEHLQVQKATIPEQQNKNKTPH